MPTTVKLRWGILGVAHNNKRLLPAFARSTHAELRAIASRSPERARAAAAAAGIPTAYGSYEQLLDDPGIDAVYNPLPNSLHAEWTMRAAERGKHVLCEKPLAPTAAEARKVVEFCRAKGVCLTDGFAWPHHPRTARLRQVLDAGRVGVVRRVTGAFTFPLSPLDPANIRMRADLGGGSLLDVGCYPVFAIRWIFGLEPVRVSATASYHLGIDTEVSCILDFADGRVGAFDCGFTLPHRGWLEIAGTEGVISIPDMWQPSTCAKFTVQPRIGTAEEVVVEGEDQVLRTIENFSLATLESRPVSPPPEEAVRTLRVLDALADSAQAGRVVTLTGEAG
jgi:D-xylose 1-dehydrogenase (NADP+, D-xylono-1,5-lactone-forming)